MHFPLPLAAPLPLTSGRYWALLGAVDGVLLLLAWLAQREGTRPARLALVPLAYVAVWQLSGGIAFDRPLHDWLNYVIGLGGVYVALLIPRLALLETPYTHPRPPPSTTVDLLSNPSLAGWNKTPYYNPPRTVKPPFRSAGAHLLVVVRDSGLMFALTMLARPFDRLLDTRGASIWELAGEDVPWLPGWVPYVHPLHRDVGAVGVTVIFGLCVYLFVECIYHSWAALSIALGWAPSEFGEIFDRPWQAESMHDFWGKRWHPLFAPTFAFYSHPLPPVLKPAAVFLVSGLIHDLGALPFRPGELSPAITLFFFVQCVALGLERLWSKAGLGRVGGPVGRIWTIGWIVGTGMIVVEGWLKKGLLGMAVRTIWSAAGVDK